MAAVVQPHRDDLARPHRGQQCNRRQFSHGTSTMMGAIGGIENGMDVLILQQAVMGSVLIRETFIAPDLRRCRLTDHDRKGSDYR